MNIVYNNENGTQSSFKKLDITRELENRRNFAMTITSKRNTGKSVLLKDLCYRMRNWFDKVYVFSMTAHLQPELFDFVDEENITIGFNEQKLTEIWDNQQKLVHSLKNSGFDSEDIPKILILFDDLIGDKKVKHSNILDRYYVASRHIHISVIFITQTFTGIPPIIRTNVDVAIAFYLDSYDNRYDYTKQYLSVSSKKEGVGIFEEITRDQYRAICVLNFITSQNLEDSLRWYIAEPKLPRFRMSRNSRFEHAMSTLMNKARDDKYSQSGIPTKSTKQGRSRGQMRTFIVGDTVD